MSLITRCPACETLFKVVPDQLRISEGWVRCGRCDEIFDASHHLVPSPQPESTPAAAPQGAAAPEPVAETRSPTSWPLDIDLASDLRGQHDALASAPLPEPDESSREWLAAPAAQAEPDAHAALDAPEPGDPEEEPEAAVSEPSFLRDRHARAFWHRPLMRATLGVLSVLLLLGLLGQVVLHERDRIAAFEPGLKPWLLALCAPLKCSLSAPRRIDAIMIDSASFIKVRGDAYRLNVTLKNSAMTALAVPAVELTLTDVLDQAVVRRVFFPAELGGPSETLAAGSEWATSLALGVKAAGAAERVAGYRVLVFYP